MQKIVISSTIFLTKGMEISGQFVVGLMLSCNLFDVASKEVFGISSLSCWIGKPLVVDTKIGWL